MAPAAHPLTHELRCPRARGSPGRAAAAPVLLRVAHWMTHGEYDLRSPLWQPPIEQLGRRLEVVRYDERGCGLSTGDQAPLGLAASTEELPAVVQARGAPKLALFGAPGAAAPAIGYAVQHPERVSHLVLPGSFSHGLLHRGASADALAFHEAQLRLIELGWGRKDPGVQQLFTSRYMPDGSAAQIAALNEQRRLSCDGRRAAAIVRARAGLDIRMLAPRLRVPTLIDHFGMRAAGRQ